MTITAFASRAALCAALIFATPAAFAADAPTKAPDKVSLRFGFVATGLDALWTYGIERGFFRDQGIDLELREGKGSAVTAQTVAAGTDDFGTDVDGGTFLTLAAKGLPATAVMAIASKSPLVIASPAASPIETPAQLAGKKIAITAGDGPSTLLPALLEQNHVDRAKVTEINMQPGPKLTSLLSGRVDGVATNVIVKASLEAKGMKVHSLMYADFGVVTPGLYVITANKTIADKPELVKRFVAAAAKSMEATQQDPAAAAEAFHKAYPSYDKAIAEREIKIIIDLFRSPSTVGKPLGYVSLADAKSGAAILQTYGSLPAGADVTRFVTDRFITP